MPSEILTPWRAFLRDVDRALHQDVEFLVRKGIIDPHLLEKRFEAELRPYVLNEDRHTSTLRLWLDEFFSGKDGTVD